MASSHSLSMSTPAVYRITVRGKLCEALARHLDGLNLSEITGNGGISLCVLVGRLIEAPGRASVKNAISAASQLGAVHECSDDGWLARRASMPTDAELRERVLELEALVVEARTRHDLGDPHEGARRIAGLRPAGMHGLAQGAVAPRAVVALRAQERVQVERPRLRRGLR